MKIIDLIRAKQARPLENRQPVIAFFGDSVTHGCFETYMKGERMETAMYPEEVYHAKVRKILSMLYPEVPVTIVNGGISGDSASQAKVRLDRDILSFAPDLVVVCFGLNDATRVGEGLTPFVEALEEIFEKIRATGAEVIFMTPNLRTDVLDIPFADEPLNACARQIVENQRGGWLTAYMDEARALCTRLGVPVCDCNKLWLTMKNADVDINHLLSNRINHPTAEMHWLFAYELVKTMFEA